MSVMEHPRNVTAFQQTCQQTGGYLTEINTEDEYTHLLNFVKTSIPHGIERVMLGATVFGGNAVTDERNWVYMSPPHGRVTFFKWPGDSVTYPDKDRNCMSLLWNCCEGMHNWYCHDSLKSRYLCEREIGKQRSIHVTIYYEIKCTI